MTSIWKRRKKFAKEKTQSTLNFKHEIILVMQVSPNFNSSLILNWWIDIRCRYFFLKFLPYETGRIQREGEGVLNLHRLTLATFLSCIFMKLVLYAIAIFSNLDRRKGFEFSRTSLANNHCNFLWNSIQLPNIFSVSIDERLLKYYILRVGKILNAPQRSTTLFKDVPILGFFGHRAIFLILTSMKFTVFMLRNF